MRSKRARGGLMASLALAVPAIGGANEPAGAQDGEPQLDGELLEFLGSVDDLDADWTEYLARTDITELVRMKRTSTPKDETND